MALAFDTDEAARCRALWANKGLADVLVVFSTQPEAVKRTVQAYMAQPYRPTARNNTTSQLSNSWAAPSHAAMQHPAPVEWPEGCVVLEAHQVQLYKSSEYFRRQLEGDADLHAQLFLPKQHASGMHVPQRVVVVGVEGREELDAAEHFMRLMYHHDVRSELRSNPQALFFLCLLADQLQARSCALACASQLNSLRLTDDLPRPFIYRLLCMADSVVGETLPQLKDMAKKYSGSLMRDYGDADRVANSHSLRAAFCALPLPVLRYWVSNPQLRARSENTIVWLLQAYYKAQWEALTSLESHASLDASMRPLAAHIRLRHLSPAYLHQVLPQLPWFGPKENLGVACCVARDSSAAESTYSYVRGEYGFPSAWFQHTPRPQPPSTAAASNTEDDCTLELNIPETDIAAAIMRVCRLRGEAVKLYGPTRNIRGFQLRAWLKLAQSADDASGVRLGIYTGQDPADCPLPAAPVFGVADTGRIVDAPKAWTQGEASSKRVGLITGTWSWGHGDPLNLGPIASTAPLQPYLSGRLLRVRLRVTQVDGMQL